MDPSSWWLIAVYLIFIVLSAYFAACESAYAATNKIRLKSMADDGNRRAKRALSIVNDFDRALTTILIGINVTHMGSASIATIFAINVWKNNQDAATLVSTIVTTVIMFLVAEMLPKSFAKSNADFVALSCASLMRFFMRILYPFTLVFLGITKLSSKIFKAEEEPTVTEDELVDIIDAAEESGVFGEEQSELLQSALEFSSTTVSDVLTLRENIEALDINLPAAELLAAVKNSTHSRIPVYAGDLDHIIGILHIRRFLKNYIKHDRRPLRELLSPVSRVSPAQPIDELLSQMSREKTTMAIVCDAEGKTLGLVTTEDFLEELVGEIWDETDVVDESLINLGGNKYEVSGEVTLGRLFEETGYASLRLFKSVRADMTVAEWVSANLDGMIAEDASFEWDGLTVTVESVGDDGSLSKALVKVPSPELEAALEEARPAEAEEDGTDTSDEEVSK